MTDFYKGSSILIIAIAILCTLILAFAFQGARGIWQPDEGYYVGTALTMMKAGNLLIPKIGEEGSEIFLEKPPLLYWGIMAGLRVFGRSEFAARAFNALCYCATVAVIGALSLSMFGDKRTAVASSIMYATMVIPFIAVNFVTPDTPLTLWTTLAVLCFWKSVEPDAKRVRMWQLLMCVAVGLGFLTKGPAVLIPCAGMFTFLLVRRRTVQFFFTPWALVGVAIFCLIGLGWYSYVSLKVQGAASYFFDNQVWGRLVSPKYRRNPGLSGAFIYVPIILFGTLPWSGIWWEKRAYLWRKLFCRKWWYGLPADSRALLLVCWFFAPMIILSLASSKLGLYALPVFPALAITSAQLYREKIAAGLAGLRCGAPILCRPAILMAVWIVVLLVAKVGIAHYPTRSDSRLLWKQLSGHLPEGDCEIITVDEQVYGLLFYGAMEAENTTMDRHPYPMFTPPHPFSEELKDIPTEGHHFAIVVEKKSDALRVEELLSGAHIGYGRQHLPFERSLFVIEK